MKIGNQVQDDADLMIFKWIYWELNLRDIALNVGFLLGLELHGATHLGLSPPKKKQQAETTVQLQNWEPNMAKQIGQWVG